MSSSSPEAGKRIAIPRAVERMILIGQPLAFGTAVGLSRFVSLPTTPESLLRPMVFIVIGSAISLLVAWAVTRNWVWAALISSIFILFSLREGLPAAVLLAFVLWWLVVRRLRRRAKRKDLSAATLVGAARASGIYSFVFLVLMGWSAFAAATDRPDGAVPQYQAGGRGGPNIYLILLDGYPRADTLQDTFGIDNTPFLEDLERLGFSISDGARSNYNKTWLTLATMFNGAYVDELLLDERLPADEPSQIRWLHTLIRDGSLLEILRDRGYQLRTIPAPFTSTSLTSADTYLDQGHVTEFEARLIWQSPWALLLRDQVAAFLTQDLKDRVADAFETTATLAEDAGSTPQFVFTQVQSPHPPFVLHSQGNAAARAPACFPVHCSLWHPTIEELYISLEDYRGGLAPEIATLNDMVVATVERITAADPEGVVVLFSDHGLRYSLGSTSEHFRSLLAARLPGRDAVFAADESPVNVLRRLFAAYFDLDLPPIPYRGWLSGWDATMELTPIP